MQPSILYRFLWGMVLVAVGVVFLLNQTGVISIDIGYLFANFWPVIIILFGIQGLLLQRSGGFVWNAIIVAIGFVFLGRNLNWFEWSVGDLFSMIGPLLLILFGLGMITKGAGPKNRKNADPSGGYGWNPVTPPPASDRRPEEPPLGPPPAPPLTDDPNASFSGFDYGPAAGSGMGTGASTGSGTGYASNTPPPRPDTPPVSPSAPYSKERRHRCSNGMNRGQDGWGHKQHHAEWWSYDPNAAQHHRFIGDVHIGQDYWELRPMNISHFIGDTTLDLTKAQIPVGETKIYVSCFIGDVKVFVPNDPGVGIQVVSSTLIGDVKVWDNKRGGLFNHMSVETPSYSDADKRVVLIVSAFIGDVRVTKVG